MTRVLARLILVTGAAAAFALAVRDPAASRVARALDAPVRALADAASKLSPRVDAPPPTAAPRGDLALPPPAPSTSSSSFGAPTTPSAAKKAAKAAPAKPWRVTRKEIEDAIATRVSGAKAVLVRDPDGKPAGLRLGGVARLAPFGVQEGDVLMSANGLPLRTPDEALAALGSLKDASRVVVVLRRGQGTYAVALELAD